MLRPYGWMLTLSLGMTLLAADGWGGGIGLEHRDRLRSVCASDEQCEVATNSGVVCARKSAPPGESDNEHTSSFVECDGGALCTGPEETCVVRDASFVDHCARVTGPCKLPVGFPRQSFSGNLSILVMDPFGLPNDASLYACNDGSVPPIIASFVLSARRPDGTPFVIERVFDPCNLGTPVGGGAVESFHHCDPLFVDVFRCGFLPVPEARFGETVLESGPYLYLESLTMLGIDESTQYPDTLVSLGLPDLDPVIVHSEDLGFFGNVDNVHASRRDYYVEVAFLTPDKELVAPTPPTVSPSCPAVGEEIGHGEYCCGDGFWDPGEQCDDGNTSPGDGCDAACDVEPGGAPADADQDGVPDANDQCAGTPAAQVDAAGCSRPQFCAAQDASTAVGKRSCKKSDWTNDEPLLKQKEADCIVNNLGTRDKTDDLCAPS